jgi:uncharacterized protein YutE (UPF0331/DUF86 family)
MKRIIIAILAIAIIVIRALNPDLRIDEISVALFGIIVLAIVWSDLGKLATVVRKFRLGEFEIELAERVENLARKAEIAEDARPRKAITKKRAAKLQEDDAFSAAVKRVAEAGSDPRSALLLVAIEIEQAIHQLAEENGLPDQVSTTRMVSQLAEKGLISHEEVSLIREFWQTRNDVVHQAGFNIPVGQIYAMVDVGIQILKLLIPFAYRLEAPSKHATPSKPVSKAIAARKKGS